MNGVLEMRIGITGQAGFIGTHLYNFLGLDKEFQRVHFQDSFFDNEVELRQFVRSCDVIVHLAAINRHSDMQVLHNENINLTGKLISALTAEKVSPHLIISSSTQEEKDNLYGKAKKECREMLAYWAEENDAVFTGMVIPNVFGPFGRPNYNSAVATFCHKLTHGETPEIIVDGSIRLIYVNDLCREIIEITKTGLTAKEHKVTYNKEIRVSEILTLLNYYKSSYFDKQIIPQITNYFEQCLFNTFVCYIDHQNFYPKLLIPQEDNRGFFCETLKLDKTGGQVSFSTTKPGITRGNHYHTRKFERFAVIRGKAKLQLRQIGTDRVMNFEIDADKCPGFVDMPIWVSHNITNTGEDTVYTIFWINEFYNAEDPDTFFETV